MRLYSITNMYTNGIHAGIQTAHLVHEMRMVTQGLAERNVLGKVFVEESAREQLAVYDEWAKNHKTIIVLNGGYHSNIEFVYEKLKRIGFELNLPNAIFHEADDALNGAATATGIIVPERIYMRFGKVLTEEDFEVYSEEEIELINLLSPFRLAN